MQSLMKKERRQTLQKIENSLKNLRIADVELFITASKMKNLGRAALVHHLSQSAASSAIQRVENAFQRELCTHEKRAFGLTREGKRLLPRLEKISQKIRDLVFCEKPSDLKLMMTHAIAQVVVPSLFNFEGIEIGHLRPDKAYQSVMQDEADIALVLDNYPWKGAQMKEIGRGSFQLYSRNKDACEQPVFLPEDQMEVIYLQQHWLQIHQYPLPIQSRIPSWSLIGQICQASDVVGFLPEFIAKKFGLHPVSWQAGIYPYRILALYKEPKGSQKEQFDQVFRKLESIFLS